MKNVQHFATVEKLAKEIMEVHQKSPDVWIFLSQSAIRQIRCNGMRVKPTKCEKWSLLLHIKIKNQSLDFEVEKDPKDVLFFEMA